MAPNLRLRLAGVHHPLGVPPRLPPHAPAHRLASTGQTAGAGTGEARRGRAGGLGGCSQAGRGHVGRGVGNVGGGQAGRGDVVGGMHDVAGGQVLIKYHNPNMYQQYLKKFGNSKRTPVPKIDNSIFDPDIHLQNQMETTQATIPI